MTYCLAIKIDDGLVFASDSRTSASVDDVRTYGKMHVFEYPGDRFFTLLSAGNLATTQSVLEHVSRDAQVGAATSLRSVSSMYDAAEYVGSLNARAQRRISEDRGEHLDGLGATFILGGQIAGQEPSIYLVYNLGNCITTSPETNFMQIGESKYGKPILDRVVAPHISMEDAARCALISLDATIRSNISVGPPLELLTYKRDSLQTGKRMRLEADDPFFRDLRDSWNAALTEALNEMPRFPWEEQQISQPNLQQAATQMGGEHAPNR